LAQKIRLYLIEGREEGFTLRVVKAGRKSGHPGIVLGNCLLLTPPRWGKDGGEGGGNPELEGRGEAWPRVRSYGKKEGALNLSGEDTHLPFQPLFAEKEGRETPKSNDSKGRTYLKEGYPLTGCSEGGEGSPDHWERVSWKSHGKGDKKGITPIREDVQEGLPKKGGRPSHSSLWGSKRIAIPG